MITLNKKLIAIFGLFVFLGFPYAATASCPDGKDTVEAVNRYMKNFDRKLFSSLGKHWEIRNVVPPSPETTPYETLHTTDKGAKGCEIDLWPNVGFEAAVTPGTATVIEIK
jgi:hypothetical protein